MALRFLSSENIDGNISAGEGTFVRGSSGFAIRLDSANSSTDNDLRFAKGGVDYGAIQTGGGSNDLEFYVHNGSTWIESFRVQRSTGNVGIGLSPASSVVLDVKEPDSSNDLILGLTAGTGSRAQIRSVVQTSTESALSFHTTLSSSTQERFRILNTGAFSLGNSGTNYGSAGQVLTSNGNSAPYWSTPNSGTITGSGTSGRLAKFTGTSSIGDSGISDASNAVAITINGNEEVGIGTSPFTKLDVYDSSTSVNIIRARNNTQQIALGVNDASGGAFLFVNTNHALRFGCNGSEVARFTASGSLGINNISPSYKLSVNHGASSGGGITTVANFSAGTGSAANDGAQINLNNWGDNYGGFIRTVNTQGTPNYLNPKMEFGLNYNNYLPADMATKMTILGNGNVGINTTSPSNLLHISGSGTVARLESSASYVDMILVSSGNSGFLNLGSTGMNFYVNGGSASNLHMHISNAGNVGIGNTSPGAKLTVGSNAHGNATGIEVSAGSSGANIIARDGANNHNWFPYTDGNNYYSADNHTFRGGTNNTPDYMIINSSGNVGIGTNSPLHNLQLGASGAIAVNSGYDMFSAGAFGVLYRNAYDSYIAGNTQYTASGWLNKYSGTKSTVLGMVDGAFNFEVGSGTTAGGASTLTRIVTMSNSGAVGIGVSAPNAKLEVNGDVSIRGGNGLYFGQSTGNLGSWTTRLFSSGSTQYFNGQTFIFNNVGYGSTEFVRFTSGGRVGVGVTNPSARLQVNFDGNNGGGDLTGYGILHQSSVSGQATIGAHNTGDGYANLNLSSTVSGAQKLWHISKRPSSNSNRLEYFFYDSTFYSRFIFTYLGDFHADGDIVAYSTTASDEKLKDNIEPIHNALDKVSKLNGVSFTWNCGSRKDEKDLGVIAQNVEKVLPELVREKESPYHDDQTIKTVDYEKLTAVLIEAVKELQQKVEKLENKNCACKG